VTFLRRKQPGLWIKSYLCATLVEQVRAIRAIQDVVDGVLPESATTNLDRPELNYDGIKRDVRKLFYDPQAGFDAWHTRPLVRLIEIP